MYKRKQASLEEVGIVETLMAEPVNEENTIKFTFTTNSSYVHPWGSALGQYDYLLLERA